MLSGTDYGKLVTIPTSHGPRTGELCRLMVTKDYNILATILVDGAYKSGNVGTQGENGPEWSPGIIIHASEVTCG